MVNLIRLHCPTAWPRLIETRSLSRATVIAEELETGNGTFDAIGGGLDSKKCRKPGATSRPTVSVIPSHSMPACGAMGRREQWMKPEENRPREIGRIGGVACATTQLDPTPAHRLLPEEANTTWQSDGTTLRAHINVVICRNHDSSRATQAGVF
ncbi:hypothetical protein CSOJ01_02539 [Colletotrichum sojae]|uniref:Uncharacterized protein n=1 Tax=Colletotrichum sojae TaxID=2175907 RepID=A0A8H6JPR1_9PEZI|nr:hypothetical protein CSOJ01_02539 [Colletotrichum sojae]